MPFFHFNQNNSGGFFKTDHECGITHHVVIEAPNAGDANEVAITKGIYFGGCRTGQDCPCCGDRWYPAYLSEGQAVPMVYNHVLGGPGCSTISTWMAPFPECVVHYADGRTVWFDGEGRQVEAPNHA